MQDTTEYQNIGVCKHFDAKINDKFMRLFPDDFIHLMDWMQKEAHWEAMLQNVAIPDAQNNKGETPSETNVAA